MINKTTDFFMEWGLNQNISNMLSYLTLIITIILITMIIEFLTKKIALTFASKYINKFKWGNALLENKVFQRAVHLVPAILIYLVAPLFGKYSNLAERIANSFLIVSILSIINAILNTIIYIYTNDNKEKKFKPVKTYIQVLKIIIYFIGFILLIASILDKSPALLLGGLGAASAVLSLVFKDSILGFVASTQLSTNDMIRIGDWIQIPGQNVDGTVIDISLTTVKVQNFDKTISTIPAYNLFTGSFKNWRGMRMTGGRRIKRPIYIDPSSVRFCDQDMINSFRNIKYISEYIDTKIDEINKYNTERNIDINDLANGRHLTNLGTFRAYIIKYLENNPFIHKELIHMARQLELSEYGIPIEVYAFTNTTVWVDYERIQSDIFDHLYAIAPFFGLRIYQPPTGHDIRSLRSEQ